MPVPSVEFLLLLGLAALATGVMLAVHAFRDRITLAPTFGVAGVLTLMLWQLVQLGWWVDWGSRHIEAALVAIVPALLLGAVLIYALDGLRVARIYLLVVLSSSLLAWGFSEFRVALSQHVLLPYSFIYSTRTHLGWVLGFSGGGLVAMLAYEIQRKSRWLLPFAPVPALLSGVLSWLAISSYVTYGWRMGNANLAQSTPDFMLFALPTAAIATYVIMRATRRGELTPARPLLDLIALWRSTESNLQAAREDALAAKQIASDLRRLNAALEEAERTHAHQVRTNPLGIVDTDLAGHIKSINPAAAALFEELGAPARLSTPLPEVLAMGGMQESLQLSPAMREATTVLLSKKPDGKARWLEATVLPLFDSNHQTCGFNILFKDVTHREITQIRQSMEKRVKDIHSAGRVFAHDFSNILLGAQTHLDLLAQRTEDVESTALIKNIRTAINRSRDMLVQLNDSPLLSRPELKPCGVGPLLAESMAICQANAQVKNIELSLSEASQDAWIDVDPTQIVRVFTNLINNAIRVLDNDGHIECLAAVDNGGVLVQIMDDGPGMTLEQIGQAFDPGFSTRKEGQGGLGLAISYLIVDAHGGQLRLANRVAGGLCASVWLPRRTIWPPASRTLENAGIMIGVHDPARSANLASLLEGQLGATAAEVAAWPEVEALLEEDAGLWLALVAEPDFLHRREASASTTNLAIVELTAQLRLLENNALSEEQLEELLACLKSW